MSTKPAISEEKEVDNDEHELIEWLQKNDLSDIQHALIQKKYTLLTFKYLNPSDMDSVIEDLKTDSNLKLTVPQVLRFKAAVKNLSAASKPTSRHHKSSKSEYTYSIDLNEFYSTTQTITIIGGSRVGKSSIKDVIIGGTFDENRFPTIRMKEQPELYIAQIKRARSASSALYNDRKNIEVKYHIWDCPGQKALEHIPPLYITGAMAILIVYDITDNVTWKRAIEWMRYIRDEAKGYDRVLVVGNKKDLAGKREVTYEEANNECMGFGYNYIETSAKSGTNINTLQKWFDSHTQNKVENKIKEYNRNDEWKNERIRLEAVLEKHKNDKKDGGKNDEAKEEKEDLFSCCDF